MINLEKPSTQKKTPIRIPKWLKGLGIGLYQFLIAYVGSAISVAAIVACLLYIQVLAKFWGDIYHFSYHMLTGGL